MYGKFSEECSEYVEGYGKSELRLNSDIMRVSVTKEFDDSGNGTGKITVMRRPNWHSPWKSIPTTNPAITQTEPYFVN